MGEAKLGPLRVNFDRRLKLEFHGSDISSDGGLLPYRELDDAFKIVRHGRYFTFQLAEVAIPRTLFAEILRLIARLRPASLPP